MAEHNPWKPLDDALAALKSREGPLDIWWRDDDTTAMSPELEKLLALRARHGVPVALAVIPKESDKALPESLPAGSTVDVLVHGLAHENHAPPAERKAEFGPHRPAATMLDELDHALSIIRKRFPKHFLPVFVPPWNRMDKKLVPELAGLGYCGLSRLGPRENHGKFLEINAHVEVTDWKKRETHTRERFAALLAKSLRACAASGEPLGIVSHHRIHDDKAFALLDEVFARLRAETSLRWPSAREMFARAPA